MSEQKCGICGEKIMSIHRVYCRNCNLPHHQDCFDYAKQCSRDKCQCSEYVDERKPAVDGEEDLVRNLEGHYQDFGSEIFSLDADVDDENLLQLTSVVFFVIGLFFHQNLFVNKWTWYVAAFLMCLRFFISYSAKLNNEEKTLLYTRSIFGKITTWRICSFEDIKAVGVCKKVQKSKNSHSVTYSAYLELSNEEQIVAGAYIDDFNGASRYARRLAEHIETKFNDEGSVNGYLLGAPSVAGKEIVESRWSGEQLFGRVQLYWQLYFALILILAIFAGGRKSYTVW